MIDVQITRQEAQDRKTGKGIITSCIGIPMMFGGVLMLICKLYDAFSGRCPECHFTVIEIVLMITSGYGLYAAKDSLITGMIGLLLPKK